MLKKKTVLSFIAAGLSFFVLGNAAFAKQAQGPYLSARAAIVIDPQNGGVLYSKNPHMKLPPASTTKMMTVLLALEKFPLNQEILVKREAFNVAPSKAGLTLGAKYRMIDLVVACLVSSSNDAAVALAQAVGGTQENFAILMNERALKLGMRETKFINATGLTERGRKQYSTAYDLTLLMRYTSRSRLIDKIMGILETSIKGSDGKVINLRSHNKMLWRMPKYVKGKTGWTYASKHTFVGTDYAPDKKIVFAMLSSKKPWADIERLAAFGLLIKNRNSFWNSRS